MPAIAFAISLFLRWMTLAPGLTFEDSGELAAAAYTLGVAHSPGYPLFTLLGKAFTLLPLGSVAYRLNLMSAVCASLAAAVLAATLLRILDPRTPLARWTALGAAIWLATSLEVWEQSVITEVYALNLLVVATFLWTLAGWKASGPRRSPSRALLLACFLAGLATTTHATALILVPVLLVFVAVADPARLSLPRSWAAGALCFAAGLLPHVYLPLASRFDPPWDWGNPDRIGPLGHTLARNFSRVDAPWSLSGTLAQLRLGAALLGEQWPLPFLALALAGLVALLRRDRAFFALAVAFLLLAGPGVTLATNIDVAGADPVRLENAAQVSVYYIPLYLCVALLMGLGLELLVARLLPGRRAGAALACGVVVVALALSYPTYRRVDMSDYRFAEDYVHDVSVVLEPGALLFVGWDSFYFPLVYGSIVEGRRTDLVVLDLPLLRSSWYVGTERRRSPSTFEPAHAEVEVFLREVAPFERGEAHDPRRIQAAYDAMLRALVDRSYERGRAVYFADRLPPSIAVAYSTEPVVVARRLTRDPAATSPIDYDELRFRGFGEQRASRDRWVRTFGRHYGTLLFERASRVEQRSDPGLAERLYRQAALCLPADDPLRSRVEAAIERTRTAATLGAAVPRGRKAT